MMRPGIAYHAGLRPECVVICAGMQGGEIFGDGDKAMGGQMIGSKPMGRKAMGGQVMSRQMTGSGA